MRTLAGAGSVVLVALAVWLLPSNTDSAFMTLPPSLKLLVLLCLVAIGLAGVVLFVYNFICELS